ncbi:MAG: aldehyde dehydrogenase family protein [Planctomycetota bacterium]|jgi:succinylglutamic semialdehyde dehydrogenase|nr:aldehyde dehydrogenase family protein [Planctomycetota bacterium]
MLTDAMLTSRSPWNWDDDLGSFPIADAVAVGAAVSTARQAWHEWADQSAHERIARLLHFAALLADQAEPLAALLARETGKTPADAAAEVALLPKKVAITCEQALALTPGLPSHLPDAEPRVVWRPRGVAAVLGPFNFPLHLLHGLVVPALAVGCTVVAKPSEHCPAVTSLYGQLAQQAGLGAVVQLVQGGADVVAHLCADPSVATVAAVGGRSMGLAVQGLLAARPEVVLALELGGVNQALVCDDADLAVTIPALAEGAWKMAGQRCTATRVVHVPRAHCARVVDGLRAAAQEWSDEAQIGRVISPAAREAFYAPWRRLPDGLLLLHGVIPPPERNNCAVAPVLALVDDASLRAQSLYRDEHFGPALIIDLYDDETEAVLRMRSNPDRLAASVFTASRERFLAVARELPYGQVNHNRPTAGARSDMPFGGCGRSGNGHPAALAACRIFADECVLW